MKKFGDLSKAVLVVLIISQPLFGGVTNRSQLFGARVTALNGLYFAGIDGVTNIYLNPSGLAYKNDRAAEFTFMFKSEHNSFEGDVRGLHRSIREEDPNAGVGFYWSLSNNITVGFAFSSMFDYRVNWPYVLVLKQGATNYTVATDMFNQDLHYSFSPSFAYKTGRLAAGVTFNVTRIENTLAFAQGNYNWIDTISLPVYQFDFSKEGWIWDVNIGLMYDVSDNFRIGATVRNGISKSFEGSSSSRMYKVVDSAAASSNYNVNYQTPWRIGAGIVYGLTSDAKINVDFRYNLYGKFDEVRTRTFDDEIWNEKAAIPDTLTGFSVAGLPQYYNNSFDAGIGFEYKAMADLELNFGYRFSQTPNSEKTYSLLSPTVNQHWFSAGFVYTDMNIVLEASAVYFIGSAQKVEDSDFAVHNGTYNTSGLIPGVTLKYKF